LIEFNTQHSIEVRPFKSGDGFGTKLGPFDFSLVKGGLAVSTLYLVDTDKDVRVRALLDKQVISVSGLGVKNGLQQVSVEAVVPSSFRFECSGPADCLGVQDENTKPFLLFGNNGADFTPPPWTFQGPPFRGFIKSEEQFTITATAYSGDNGTGQKGASITVKFRFKD